MPELSNNSLLRPPRFWRGVLGFLATEMDRAYLLDDLDEQFRHLAEEQGLPAARGWFRRQALISLLPILRRRLGSFAAGLPDLLRSLGSYTMTDLLHSLRLLRKNLGTTAAAVLSLVIGITLNATIFSVVDWLWLSASPFDEPDQIVRLFAADPEGTLDSFGYSDYLDIRDQTSTLSEVAATEFRGAMLTGRDGTTRLLLVEVTSRNYFDLLGLQPSVGGVYHAGDDLSSPAGNGVVISRSLWEREFGSDPALIGSLIQLTGRSYTLLGVAPVGYSGVRRMVPADIWFPVDTWYPPLEPGGRRGGAFNLLGRIASGTPVERVQAEVATVMARLDIRDEATQMPSEAVVMTDAAYQTRNYGGPGTLLLALVAAVLIIACANVAGLQLARALVRQQEMAIRMALGGRRARLIRQLLVEGLVVAAIAVVLSLVLSAGVLSVLPSLLPPQPNFMEWGFRLDARVIGFTVALALIAALLFSLLPALRASRPDMLDVLKGNDLSMRRSGRPVRGLNVLVVVQLTLSLVLISTTALLLRSFLNTQSADLGIDRRNVLLSWFVPRVDGDRLPTFYADLVEQTEALPGVRRATMARTVPFYPSGGGAALPVYTNDTPGSSLTQGAGVLFNLVGPEYFDILGISLRRGRPFTAEDHGDSPRVAIVNETMAARVWPGGDPVGRTIHLRDPSSDPVLVVGVVEDGKYNDIEETQQPYLYLPFSQMPWGEVMLLAETEGDPGLLAPAVRDVIRRLSPDTFLLPQATLAGILRDATYNRQLMALALGIFSLLGLVMALVGLYGVSTYAVNRRVREIGIRMALGADHARILRLVLTQGGRLIAIGALLGIPAAVAVGVELRGSLYGVGAVDPLSLVAATLILGAVTLLAVLVPSRRAMRVDPQSVIRYE